MKRTALILMSAVVLFAACNNQPAENDELSPLPMKVYKGNYCMELTTGENVPVIDSNVLDVQNEYNLAWPDMTLLGEEVQKELIMLAFNDGESSTLEEAGKKFLSHTWMEDDDYFLVLKSKRIDSVHVYPHNYASVKGTVRQDGNLLHFSVNTENNVAFAAHGTYGWNTLIVDRTTEKVVRLVDMMDTVGLGKVLIRALNELPVNKENGNTTECLFDEFKQSLPQPDGFYLDSTRSQLGVYYNIYNAQPYACGMLFVDMPIDWLKNQVTLTAYGKEILGIKEDK